MGDSSPRAEPQPEGADPTVLATLAALETVRPLVASAEVGTGWDRPSVLEGFSVGGLTAHLYAGLRLFERALEAPVDHAWHVLPLAAFYAANRVGDPSDLDDEFHRTIRDHAAKLAGQGHAAVSSRFGALADRLAVTLPAIDPLRPVPVWRVPGGATTAATYLRTRVVELAVHADDLAASVGAAVRLPPAVADVAIGVCLELARARAGDLAVLRAFTRAERAEPDVLRVL